MYHTSDFGRSYTIPIPKYDINGRNLCVDDFRAIATSPVISKLFEMALLERYEEFFVSSRISLALKRVSVAVMQFTMQEA